MELTDAIQSEQHVKKELARRMGELQEELHNIKEQVRSQALTHIMSFSILAVQFCIFLKLAVFSVLVCHMPNSS